MDNPGQGILMLQHGLLNKACWCWWAPRLWWQWSLPWFLPPSAPSPKCPPFFQLRILDSQTLTGCFWEICTHPSSFWSSSDEDCGLCMVTGGESSWTSSSGTQRSHSKKAWVQVLLQSCLLIRAALACFVLTNFLSFFQGLTSEWETSQNSQKVS